MRLQKRITFYFVSSSSCLLLLFSGIIYWKAQKNRTSEFYNLLEREALTKAKLSLGTSIPTETLQRIYKNNRQFINEVEVAIYSREEQLVYHDAIELDFVKENNALFTKIEVYKNVRFFQDDSQVIGFLYEYEHQTYFITAAALDAYGYAKLQDLRTNIIILLGITFLLLFSIGKYLSKKITAPLTQMTQNTAEISAAKLNFRLPIQTQHDELTQLAQSFNEMLERLQTSFESQKQFISHISHEVRTPLAALISEIELTLNKSQTEEAYQNALKNCLSDAHKLVVLTNNLFHLAQTQEEDQELKMEWIRIDELVIDTLSELMQQHPHFEIGLKYEGNTENETQLVTKGNSRLLQVALSNIMENACKFSKYQRCEITLIPLQEHIEIRCTDQGIGISPDELKEITKPFYRGSNQNYSFGSGIGLALTQKIILLHQGELIINSVLNEGTEVLIRLKNN